MAVDAMTSPIQAPKDTSNPGYRIEGDKVVNDEFLDGFTFWDALDVINPLQHIPVVNSIYRELTDDQIKAGPRLVGGLLFGGIGGLAGAAINVLSKELTGKDLGEHAIAMVSMVINGEEEVRTAQIETPSGQATSAQALDPNAPLDLLPPRWRMVANGGVNTAVLGGGSVTTQGTTPVNLPLGDDALTPLGGVPASPAVSPTKSIPGSVDVILPQRADAAASAQREAQVAGRAPGNPPLGDDALGAPTVANAQTAALQTGPATSHQPLSRTKEFSGKSLTDYRNRPVRVNAGRSTQPTASDATVAARSTAQTRHPDPAAMAQLLEAQASTRSTTVNAALDTASKGTSEGDVLRVVEPGSGRGDPAPAPAMGTYEGGDIKPDAWFAQKMMMGLEKYQKAHGGVPLSRGTAFDA
ncbi:MAG: hypothetical protein K9H25_21210 [Rhodospirillum sp.]|nr:hypothetical protein [Rhodospirillum sp.]MCF8491620.1 hypothetical protein [Rhodospirillum sp.]MCF8500139.1 hypothetical protein [Rhodospirillum sp.]